MTPGECFAELVALQDLLLAPGGCPWDREQTHHSLRTYLIEEAYEVLDALDARDPRKLAEELGDLLLQVVFHAALARRAGKFDVRDVIQSIHSKLVRRHPHVFGGVKAETSGAVLKNWEQLKAAERGAEDGAAATDGSLLDGVPQSLPATLEAYQLTRRAARVGFDWENLEGILEKLSEEAAELRDSASNGGRQRQRRVEEEAGDLLFVAVNVARFLKVDPEIALKAANRKFAARFRDMEAETRRRGAKLADASREEMERLWERSKERVERR
jgi:MazG family protein